MSLLLAFFYWVVIPVLVFLITKWLFCRVTTPFQKRAVVVISVAVSLGLLWLATGEKWWLDYQVRELCGKDGGVKVYEMVRLPVERFDKYGGIRIPLKSDMTRSDEFYLEWKVSHILDGNPSKRRDHFLIYRKADEKLLGEAVSYSRRGGDLPGPWHESSFRCPSDADDQDLMLRIFTKSN